MDKKIKLLVIGLGILAAISLLIAFQLNIINGKIQARKEVIERELAQSNKEYEKLTKDFSKAVGKNRTLTSQLEEVESKGKGLQQEIARIKERLELTSSERDSLIDKIQSLIGDKRNLKRELEEEKVKREEEKEKIIIEEEKKEEKETGEEVVAPSIYSPTSSQQSFWAEVLRQKATAELELENIKSQLKEVTYRADEIFRERNSFEMELKSVTQLKEDLERRATYNERLANSLSEDLVREKNDKEAMLRQLDGLREDNIQMRSRIKDLENTKATLYRKLDNLDQERSAIKKKLGETESIVTDRINEIVKIKRDFGKFQTKEMKAVVPGSRTVRLSPIVVHGKQDIAKPTLTGRVLSINKQNEFIIIDLGKASGVKVNDKFNIYRDNKFIASIEIILMRKDISAADIKESAVNEEIKIGDIVKLIN